MKATSSTPGLSLILAESSRPAVQGTSWFWRPLSVLSLIGLDALVLIGSLWLVAQLLGQSQAWESVWQPLLPVILAFLVLTMDGLNLYGCLLRRNRYPLVLLGLSTVSLTIWLTTLYYPALSSGQGFTLWACLVVGPSGLLARWGYDLLTQQVRSQQAIGTTTLLIGDFPDLDQARLIKPEENVKRVSPSLTRELGTVGTLAELPYLLKEYLVGRVLVTASALTPEFLPLVLHPCAYAQVEVLVLQPYLSINKRLNFLNHRQTPLLAVAQSRSYLLQLGIKRLIDFVGAGLGVLLLSPILVTIALLIRADSPGPIFFRQQRLGRNGQLFQVWKFRTMVVNAEARLQELEHLNESKGGVLFKLRQDPRITPLGQILRKTSLDELPQLFNVLQGHMSLVGPRPLQVRDCELGAKTDLHSFTGRLTVLPGITGLWQVSGRSEVDFEGMLRLDLEYVENWSLIQDLMILVRTILVVLNRTGAY